MKMPRIAPSSSHRFHISAALRLSCLSSILLLTGCDTLGLPNLSHHDEVPPEAKAMPRLVEVPPPTTQDTPWPRLGDVPFKPKDFSTKPIYEYNMDEMARERGEAEADKKNVQQQAPVPEGELPQPSKQ